MTHEAIQYELVSETEMWEDGNHLRTESAILLKDMDLIKARMEFGKAKYGHGVRVTDDTTTWMHMALEEFLDGIIYVAADYIRTREVVHSQPDDNRRILYLLENPTLMNSEKHREMVDALFKLIKMSS